MTACTDPHFQCPRPQRKPRALGDTAQAALPHGVSSAGPHGWLQGACLKGTDFESHPNKDNVANSLLSQPQVTAATDRGRTSCSCYRRDERPGLLLGPWPLHLCLRVIPSSMQTPHAHPSLGPASDTVRSANSHASGVEKNKPQRGHLRCQIFHLFLHLHISRLCCKCERFPIDPIPNSI